MSTLKELFNVEFFAGKSDVLYEIQQSPLFTYDFRKAIEVTSSNMAADAIKNNLERFNAQYNVKEYAGFLTMNQANKITGCYILGSGGLSSAIVEIRLIALGAVLSLSSNLILFHSHPSGNPKISPQDTAITRQCFDALKLFNINLLDHIILVPNNIGGYGYTSFKDEGVMPQ
jgi:DNA repair protein RadC